MNRPLPLVATLAYLSLVSYVIRAAIGVAARQIMPEFGLDSVQMGQIFAAFLIGYALFQTPFGLLGDRFGTLALLSASAVVWSLATVLTALCPPGHFALLWATRLLLGVTVAGLYPLAGRAIASAVAPGRRAFANAVVVAGLAAGSALTPPLVAFLMTAFGWRTAFTLLAVLPLAGALAWPRLAPPRPPLEESRPEPLPLTARLGVLCAAYFFESYIQYIFLFWFFLYLVNERNFPLVQGGWLAALPYLLALGSMPLAGLLGDRLALRLGPLAGRARLAAALLLAAAALLALASFVLHPLTSALLTAVSVALVLATEGPFWATAAHLAPHAPGAAGGLMNTAGNLAGVASTALVPVLAQRFGWPFVFYSAAALAALAGGLWLLLRAPRPAALFPVPSHDYNR